MELVKDIIPYVSFQDKNWKQFNKDDFNIGQYQMHDQFYNTVRNKLGSLKEEKKKAEQSLKQKEKSRNSENSATPE